MAADVVDGDVARDAQDPGEEGHVAFLVLADHVDQLGEHLLGDVFGLVLVVHDAAHVAVDVVGVARVEEAECLAIPGLRPFDRLRDEPGGGEALAAGGRPCGVIMPARSAGACLCGSPHVPSVVRGQHVHRRKLSGHLLRPCLQER